MCHLLPCLITSCATLISAVVAGGSRTNRSQEQSNWACGHSALLVLASLNGAACDVQSIQSALPTAGPHSLSEMVHAAQKIGIRLQAAHVRRCDWPAVGAMIVWTQKASEYGHFLVMRPIGRHGTYAQIIDPPDAVTAIPIEAVFHNDDVAVVALVMDRGNRRALVGLGCIVTGVAISVLISVRNRHFRLRTIAASSPQ